MLLKIISQFFRNFEINLTGIDIFVTTQLPVFDL